MKKILIYGDSNLWGFNFACNKRLEDKYQWAKLLQNYLGSNWQVIQEGLPGRIAGNYDNEKKYKNGKDTFNSIFRSAAPVDYIVIALGTNDLQTVYNRMHEDIYEDLMSYKNTVIEIFNEKKYQERFFNSHTLPKFIFVLPSNFDCMGDAKEIFSANSEKERIKLIDKFKRVCNDDFIFINDIDLIKGDGLHFSIMGHEMLFNEIILDTF